MYTYEGYGAVIPLVDFDGRMFLDFMEELSGIEFASFDDFANNEPIGTYESSDNINYAQVGGTDVDTSNGVLIINCNGGVGLTTEITLKSLYPDVRDLSNIIGDYVVECEQ